jgi:hypothetical protein
MSHTTTINAVPIRDVECLRSAVKDLQAEGVKCELVEKTTPRLYFEHQQKAVGVCDYVLKLHGSKFDVGFKKKTVEGQVQYEPTTDLWNSEVQKCIGAKKGTPPPKTEQDRHKFAIGRLMAQYTKNVTIKAGKAKGYSLKGVTENERTGGFDVKFETGQVVATV